MVTLLVHKVTAKDFGLRCVSSFAAPRPYDPRLVREFVLAALAEFASYGLGSQNFVKNDGDRLFGYTISFALFGGNATFVLTSDGLNITLLNGQGQRDIDLIKELVTRAHRCVPQPEKLTHLMSGFCHAEFIGENAVENVLKSLTVTTGPVKAVGISVLSDDPAEAALPANERIKLEIAPSELKPNRLFMAWRFPGKGTLTEEYWKVLAPRLASIAGSIGIELVSL
jgi:hypothetical protein